MLYTTRRISGRISLAILIFTLFGATSALADWSHDPTTNTLLSRINGYAYLIEAVPDGNGGMIVVWETYDSGIYAQRFDAQGNRLWGSIETAWLADGEFLDGFKLVGDGAGGAFLVWQDAVGAVGTVYAQHFDAAGQPTWAVGGVPVGTLFFAGTTHHTPDAAPDGADGLLVTWRNDHNGTTTIQVQRFGPTGTRLYSSTMASTTSYEKAAPCVIESSDPGESVVVWQERSSSGDWDIMGQRKSATGTNLWLTDSQMTLIRTGGDQTAPQIEKAANNRIVCVCEDNSTGAAGLRFGQCADDSYYFDTIGVSGKPWLGLFDEQVDARIGRDGDDNIYVTCVDRSATGGGRIAAQYFPRWGVGHVWGDYGRTLHLDEYLAPGETALAAGQDKAFAVAWEAYEGAGSYSIQQFDTDGAPIWSDSRGPFAQFAMIGDTELNLVRGAGGEYLASWSGRPISSTSSVKKPYGQKIDAQGFMGDNDLAMTAVGDRPNDQGGELWVTWDASPLDNSVIHGIANYSLWIESLNKSQTLPAAVATGDLAAQLRMDEAEVIAMQAAGWTYAGTVPAVFASEYSAFCPSMGDSTAAGIIHTGVRVIAHHEEPSVFWTGLALDGYSVDNLAPGAPLALAVVDDAGQASLSWTAGLAFDDDLAEYRVYRGAAAGFVVDENSLVGSSLSTSFLDSPAGNLAYYRVTAVDVHDNESAVSAEVMVELAVSAVSEMPVEFRHRGNYPNPFNPRTGIAFDLPRSGPVRVMVYDLGGNLIQTLVNENMVAGSHQVLWDGQDSSGRAVSSGVYFSRVHAAGKIATRSMTLVR